MEYLLLILFIISIAYFIAFSKKTNNERETRIKKQFTSPNTDEKTQVINSNIYKKKNIYTFELKGIFYNDHKKEGSFFGECKPNYSSHDRYSIGVYINNKLAGHTPKANIRLFNGINSYPDKKVFCWGFINFESYYNNYNGIVYIPIGYTLIELEEIKSSLDLIQKQNYITSKNDLTKEDFFEILENDLLICKTFFNENLLNISGYNRKTFFIPTFSKKFEEEKDWQSLVEMEKYIKYINTLSEKYLNTTLKRIQIAKEKIKNT